MRFTLRGQDAVWYYQHRSHSHVLVDPDAASRSPVPGFLRPVELWAAPQWAQPPVAPVVRYAQLFGSLVSLESLEALDSDFDSDFASGPAAGPGPVIDRSRVVDFVADPQFRPGALGTLMDAVAAAAAGGPPAVLAAPSIDTGARWIGLVSFLVPPSVGMRLSFSTFERLTDVLARASAEAGGEGDLISAALQEDDPEGWRTPVLSVVLEADLDSPRTLPRGDDLPVVIVDPRVEATVVAAGNQVYRRTHLGQRVRVTDWSRLALDAVGEEPGALERCLRRIDEIAMTTPPSGPRGHGWPGQDFTNAAWFLAAAVALTPGLPLALPTATRIILRDTPTGLQLSDDLAAALASLVAATVDNAAQAWDRLVSAREADPPRPALVQAAFESYLYLALDDDDWFLQHPPPLPATIRFDPGLATRLRSPLAKLTDRLARPAGEGEAGVRHGVLLLRAIDFAHRAARLVHGPDLAAAGLELLADRAARLLTEDGALGVRIAEQAGSLDEAALARWIVPHLAGAGHEPGGWLHSDRRPGERLPAPVLALVAPAVDADRLARLRPEELAAADLGRGPDRVALEVAVASATGRITGDPRLRGPAVRHLLRLAVDANPQADPEPLVAGVFDRLAAGEPWSAALLLQIAEPASPKLMPHLVPVALQHLADWLDDTDSARLAAALLKRVDFLPRRDQDGRERPRRTGVSDAQAQLLNLLAVTGPGWQEQDDGLHRRAAELLMFADRAWPGLDPGQRRLIAPRVTVAAFAVAIAAEPAQRDTELRSRLPVVPVGRAWREAVPLGLDAALPLVAGILRQNRHRLAGEVVMASTRAVLRPGELAPQALRATGSDVPRLSALPVGPVLRRLVETENEAASGVAFASPPTRGADAATRLTASLAALAEAEVRSTPGPVDRVALRTFWEQALPGAVPAVDPFPFHNDEPEVTSSRVVTAGESDRDLRFRLRAARSALGGYLSTGPIRLPELPFRATPPHGLTPDDRPYDHDTPGADTDSPPPPPLRRPRGAERAVNRPPWLEWLRTGKRRP
ncbi:hypothetical protein [Kineosporia mesophila]|nr:hypothetical protein [Kineosporia mesophila]MCD5350079.1 hypothetical protein [Kineosporia mesophila]